MNEDFSQFFLKIEAKKAELNSIRPFTQEELERLQKEFLTEFTYDSNAIEGSTLTLRETALVLEGLTIGEKPLKDHLEAVGHRDAFLYIQDIANEDATITESVIKNIHSLVLINSPNNKGVYRRIPVKITGASTQPVQPYLIEPKMIDLLINNEERKKSLNIIERIAKFHLEFESIHPFIDGNGRTGRLIMNLDLIQNGYPPINVKFTDRKKYYNAFEQYSIENSDIAMIELVANYVEQQLDDYLQILNPLSKDIELSL